MRLRAEISHDLGLTEVQIGIWFRNQRAKKRKKVPKKCESEGFAHMLQMGFGYDSLGYLGHLEFV